MRISGIRLGGALCTLLLAACGGGSGDAGPVRVIAPPSPPPAAGVMGDGRLPELVEWTRDAYGLPAMAIVVVLDGRIAEQAAVGLRSVTATEPVTTADAWHLGSLTKAFTATLAGVLVEQSVIRWDTTPMDVWPELDATIHSQYRAATLRDLLAHTTGLQRVNSAPSKYGDAAAGTVVEKRRRFAADLLASAPVSPPGRHSYSNGGYIVAGAMLETLMSASWESLLADYVLGPLAMSGSGFGAPGNANGFSQPWGHSDSGRSFDPVPPGPGADNPQVFGPAGTLHATLGDYARFMIAHLDGARGIGGILGAASYATLHTPVADGAALGWGVGDSEAFPGQTELRHAGSNGRWYAIVRLVPGLNGGVLFVVNAGGDFASRAIDDIDDVIAERYRNLQ